MWSYSEPSIFPLLKQRRLFCMSMRLPGHSLSWQWSLHRWSNQRSSQRLLNMMGQFFQDLEVDSDRQILQRSVLHVNKTQFYTYMKRQEKEEMKTKYIELFSSNCSTSKYPWPPPTILSKASNLSSLLTSVLVPHSNLTQLFQERVKFMVQPQVCINICADNRFRPCWGVSEWITWVLFEHLKTHLCGIARSLSMRSQTLSFPGNHRYSEQALAPLSPGSLLALFQEFLLRWDLARQVRDSRTFAALIERIEI